jgi:hypothetical protein
LGHNVVAAAVACRRCRRRRARLSALSVVSVVTLVALIELQSSQQALLVVSVVVVIVGGGGVVVIDARAAVGRECASPPSHRYLYYTLSVSIDGFRLHRVHSVSIGVEVRLDNGNIFTVRHAL